jgi:sulfate adenylyltransferase subunit 2
MITFRDRMAAELDLNLIVHTNTKAIEDGVHPIRSGSTIYTREMKTRALRDALDKYRFDAAIGGARRDEEPSRSKERIFSVRGPNHSWDPRRQRPELWHLYNTQAAADETMRVFPLSNWTELDVWEYILAEDIPVVPLYFAKPRPVVERGGSLIMVDDERLELLPK